MEVHKAKVMGRIERKVYKFGRGYYSTLPHVYEEKELIKHEDVWSGELENPPLEVGESLFIETKSIKTKVLDKAKSTEGGFVYWTDHVIALLEDEETENSKKKSEVQLEEYEKHWEERRNKEKEVRLVKHPVEVRKWYQLWK